MKIISYEEYMKAFEERTYTTDWEVPDTPVLSQPGDKIIAYMKSQFASQVPYYTVGIRSVNTDLSKYEKNKDF